nr:MetaGeneMark_Unknown Function [uncultured bacterium]
MDTHVLVGGIALAVWLVLMIPAALIFFAGGDPTIADLTQLPAGRDNVTQLPRPDHLTDDLAA